MIAIRRPHARPANTQHQHLADRVQQHNRRPVPTVQPRLADVAGLHLTNRYLRHAVDYQRLPRFAVGPVSTEEHLGTDRSWPVALIGVGNLGRALLRYKGFEKQGFRVTAAFDAAADKIGSRIEGIPVFPLVALTQQVREHAIRLAIIAVPATEAQAVANEAVSAGVVGILNFAPVMLSLPEHIQNVGVDLAMELEQLSFAVVNSVARS